LGPALWIQRNNHDDCDWVEASSSTDFDFGTGKFTVEYWVNNVTSTYGYDLLSYAGASNVWSMYAGYGNYMSWLYGASSVDHAYTWALNRWYHVAVTRDESNNLLFFINGTLVKTTASHTYNYTGNTKFAIGSPFGAGYGSDSFYRNVRIVKGECLYTSSFTPSQSGLSITNATTHIFKFDEDNGSTTFTDTATTPLTLTRRDNAGTALIKYTEDYRSCIFKDETGKFPYPVGSAKVDFFTVSGSGVYYGTNAGNGYLDIDASNDWKFGTDPLTYETYFRASVAFASNGGNLMDCSVYGSGGWGIRTGSATQIDVNTGGSSQNDWDAVTVPTMLTNTWYHVAVSRSGTTTKVFLNGAEYASIADSFDYQPARKLSIGNFFYTFNSSNENQWDGLLDNIRISKGVARYTSTFNTPEFRTFTPRAIMF
jgi:hypothetical protein